MSKVLVDEKLLEKVIQTINSILMYVDNPNAISNGLDTVFEIKRCISNKKRNEILKIRKRLIKETRI